MKKLPFTRDGFTLFIDTDSGHVRWIKTDNRSNGPFAELTAPEFTSRAVLEPDYAQNPVKACQRALRLTKDVDWKCRLTAINTLLGMCGTEAIRGEWQNGYWCDIVAAYCNAGDTYDITVIHLRGDGWNESGRFIVGNVGDFVERNGRKYGII